MTKNKYVRWAMRAGLATVVLGIVVRLGVPSLLGAMGLHPHYEIPAYRMAGKKALVIATNHDRLGEGGDATGAFGSELTVPYYGFVDAGFVVDLASPKGGRIPIEPGSMDWPLATPADIRFKGDPEAMKKLETSKRVADLNGADYDVVFLVGGWGAAYDLGQSADVGNIITQANNAGAVVGGICHGPLGLLQAKAPDGRPLVEGRKLTAVSDLQVEQLGIQITPLHPETELRKLGALYEKGTAFRDFFANHIVVDGTLVTGQNQNSGAETTHRMIELVEKKR